MRFRAGGAGLTAVVLAALAGCGPQGAAGAEGTAGPVATNTAPVTTPSSTAPASTAPATGSASAVPGAESVTLSSAELQGRWWTWAASEPEATNPVADLDGSDCGRHQPHDVWFLAGTFGGQVKRACKVPGGRPIAVPVINHVGDRASCTAFMSGASGTVLFDGKVVAPEAYEGDSITVRGAQGNPVTGEERRFTATGCGLWVQLPPPAPGTHALKVRGRSGDFAIVVDYALTVAASAT